MLHNFGGGEEQALTARSQGTYSSITRDSKFKGKYKSVNPHSSNLQEKLESELYKLTGADFSFAPTLCEKSVKIHTSSLRCQTVDRFVHKERKNKKQFKVKSWIFQPTIGTYRLKQSTFLQKSLPMSVDVKILENELGKPVKKFEITKSFSVDKSLVSKDESELLSRSLDDVNKEFGKRGIEGVEMEKSNEKMQGKIEEEKENETEVGKIEIQIDQSSNNKEAKEEKIELDKNKEKLEKEEVKKEESNKILEENKEEGQVLKTKSLSKISIPSKEKKIKELRAPQKSKTIALKTDKQVKKTSKDVKTNQKTKDEAQPTELSKTSTEIESADIAVQEKKVDFKIAATEDKQEQQKTEAVSNKALKEIKESIKEEKSHEEEKGSDKIAEDEENQNKGKISQKKKIVKSKTVKPRSGSMKSSKDGKSEESTPKHEIEELKIGKKAGIKIDKIDIQNKEIENLGKSQSLSNLSDLTTDRTSVTEKQTEPNYGIKKEETHVNSDEPIVVKNLDLIKMKSEGLESKQEKQVESPLKKALNTATEEKKKGRSEVKHSSLVSTQKTSKTLNKSKSTEKIPIKKTKEETSPELELNIKSEPKNEPKNEPLKAKEEAISIAKQDTYEAALVKEEAKIEASEINPESQDKPATSKRKRKSTSSPKLEEPKEEQKSKKSIKAKQKTVVNPTEQPFTKEEEKEISPSKDNTETAKSLPKEEQKTKHKKGKSIGQPITEQKKNETQQESHLEDSKKLEEEKTTPWSQKISQEADKGNENGEVIEEVKLVKQKSTKKSEENKGKTPNKPAGKKLSVKTTVKGVTKIIHFASTDSAEDVVNEFTEKNEMSKKDKDNLLKEITLQLKKK